MCGIFGILTKNNHNLSPNLLLNMTNQLFKLSESRGKEAAGFAIRTNQAIYSYKSPTSASYLIKSSEYRRVFHDVFNNINISTNNKRNDNYLAIIGHSRLVTNGTQSLNYNNQPVSKDGAVVIHNGIIVNHEHLWKRFPSMERTYEVDTEIIPSLIQKFHKEEHSLIRAVQKTFRNIEGSASIAALFNNTQNIILATNTGSLYVCINQAEDICIFTSEKFILETFVKKNIFIGQNKISQIKSSYGYLINLPDLKTDKFSFDDETAWDISQENDKLTKSIIIDYSVQDNTPVSIIKETPETIAKRELTYSFDEFAEAIGKLRRCTKCVLPETMPFIEFDEKGVCNYCKNYAPLEIKGEDSLNNFITSYRGTSGRPDCIVTLSGGRDSCYSLHYVKTILKMNPIAYTYDWGMITDLARRNQARMCGKLGIEHILISADINTKRAHIRKNVEAWLKKPDLGTVPLFMAGDKQYFYYANKLRKQTDVELVIMGMNLFEKTDFKTGFCRVKPPEQTSSSKGHYALSFIDQIKLAAYYGKHYLLNTSYLNSSIFDTLFAFFSYYSIPHDFMNIYQYIPWDENNIISTLIHEYNWEVAEDSGTTWRIGDGTAAFYNYIYFTVAGFTENDTFRSNQIREGIITREEALKSVQVDNNPRYNSIKWYCDTINIDYETTLRTINSIPKLYNFNLKS